jgi:hypothetical protein
MGGLLEELELKHRVEAQDKRITITPSGFREGLHLPRQNIENLDERRLKLLVWDEVYIELEFDSVDDTQHFTTALGNLDLSVASMLRIEVAESVG